jgi:hypothetical protein
MGLAIPEKIGGKQISRASGNIPMARTFEFSVGEVLVIPLTVENLMKKFPRQVIKGESLEMASRCVRSRRV